MKKKIVLCLFLISLIINVIRAEQNVFIEPVEDFANESYEDSFVDFDTLLSLEYDPDNPEKLNVPQKNPIEYVPPIIRTIGFVLFTSYIELHNAVKKKFKRVRRYLLKMLYEKSHRIEKLRQNHE